MYEIDFNKPIHVYFIGIGGISMSGLAEILLDSGFTVSGSDAKQSPLTDDLTLKGAFVYYGHNAEHIKSDIDLIVYTAAIKAENPELIAANSMQIPILSRAELLGQIMRKYGTPIAVSGTHGKTTTTSMISEILLQAKLDPTLSIGGILKSIQGNFRIGKSEYFVTEACEYTNSFLKFFPKVAVILNVEEDHMDFFHDIHEIRDSFHQFATLLPSDGTLIINRDIPEYETITSGLKCKIITFGKTNEADYSCFDITYNESGYSSFYIHRKNKASLHVNLSVPGEHNVLNALAAFALADNLSVDESVSQEALAHFKGSDRRFELKGSVGGVTIIDDYAHHPAELLASIQSVKALYAGKKVLGVFQPHLYSRTHDFYKEFAASLSYLDEVVLVEIYPARELPIPGVTSQLIFDEVTCPLKTLTTKAELIDLLKTKQFDVLLTVGAGDIDTYLPRLVEVFH